MALKFETRAIALKCAVISDLLELDIITDTQIRLTVYAKGWQKLTKGYKRTDLRMQKIEELLEILKW